MDRMTEQNYFAIRLVFLHISQFEYESNRKKAYRYFKLYEILVSGCRNNFIVSFCLFKRITRVLCSGPNHSVMCQCCSRLYASCNLKIKTNSSITTRKVQKLIKKLIKKLMLFIVLMSDVNNVVNEILNTTLINDFHFDCLQLYSTLNDIFYCINIILSFININCVVLWSTHSIELVNYQK